MCTYGDYVERYQFKEDKCLLVQQIQGREGNSGLFKWIKNSINGFADRDAGVHFGGNFRKFCMLLELPSSYGEDDGIEYGTDPNQQKIKS